MSHPDVVATLDAPSDEGATDTIFIDGAADVDIGDGLFVPSETDAPSGIQQKFLWAVQKRVRLELLPPNNTKKNAKIIDKWLVRYLKKNQWWIHKNDAPWIAEKLQKSNPDINLGKHHVAYYRKIFVWIPDERWGAEATPCCPHCLSNKNVGGQSLERILAQEFLRKT